MKLHPLLASAAIAAAIAFSPACSAEDLDAETAYAEASIFGGADTDPRAGDEPRHRGRPGHLLRAFRDCYTVEWPVTLAMPEGAAVEVGSFRAAREALRDWREANPDVELSRDNRPELTFPIGLVDSSGATIEVADREQLRELVRACVGDRDGRGARPRGSRGGGLARLAEESCVRLVYPVTVNLPGGRSEEVADREAMLALGERLRAEFADRPRGERPSRAEREGLGLVFPVEVTLPDGSVASAADRRALRDLYRDACAEGEG